MLVIEPKSLKIPEANNRYVVESINDHINAVNQNLLDIKSYDPLPTAPETSRHHHLPILRNKPKLFVYSSNRRKLHKRNERDVSSLPTSSSTHASSQVNTQPQIHRHLQLPQLLTDAKEPEQPHLAAINPKHYLKELNKIDAATLDSLKTFIIHNEVNNQLHEDMKKKLVRIIQREHRLFTIVSDEYLQLNKSDFEVKRSAESKNLDYILSKLNYADYYNIHQKMKTPKDKEMEKWKQLNRVENKRHEKVQSLFNRISKQ